MKTVYFASLLLWWLTFFFGKTHAQTVQFFSNGNTNGDIEVSPQGDLWGVVRFSDSDESGFEQVSMNADILQYQTFAGRQFQYIGTNAQWIYLSDPEANTIYRYNHSGQCLDSITEVDHPGNPFVDADGNVYVIETELKKLVKFSPSGVKTVLVADNFLNNNYALTGDPEGNLYTANRYTGQLFRWEKETGELYAFAQLPTGTLCADGSQVSEIVYSYGHVYAASVGLSTIYDIDALGTVKLLAGSPGLSQELNDVGNKARFVKPVGLAASLSGDTLFVSDNGHIRKIIGLHPTAGIAEQAAAQQPLLYPNPAVDQVQVRLGDQMTGQINWRLINAGGKAVDAGQTMATGSDISLTFQSQPCGTYYLEITDPKTGRHIRIAVLLCPQTPNY